MANVASYIAKLEEKLHIEKKNLATSVTMKGGEFQIVFLFFWELHERLPPAGGCWVVSRIYEFLF